MDFETGTLMAMAIGIAGSAVLTAWCLWSRYREGNDPDNR